MTKKNKHFNYKPRYQQDDLKLHQDDIQAKWQDLKGNRSRKTSFLKSPLFLVLFLIAILILMYVLARYE